MQRCTLKHFSKFLENRGLAWAWLSTLERTCRQRIYARAWLPSLERTINFMKSTRCMQFTLDGRSTSAWTWDSGPRSSVNSLAWADCKRKKLLGTYISRSSTTFHARAEVHDSKGTLEREVLRSSVGPISGIFWFIPKHKTQLYKPQIQSFWANILEKHFKPII